MTVKDVLTVNGKNGRKVELDNLSQRSPVQWKMTDDLRKIIKTREENKKGLRL